MLVELYTRKGCHLCDVAKEVIDRVRLTEQFELRVLDVDSDAQLAERYGQEVPVILVNGRKHAKYRLDERLFLDRLRRGVSRLETSEGHELP